MELNLGQWVVIGICVVLIFGYIRGFYYNRRRAEQILAWLREGLKALGQVSAGEKLPGMATGGRLEVKQATAPFRRAEAVYLLTPRDNLFFWLFHRIQGRGDELLIWVTFKSKPEHDVEIGRRRDHEFEKRLKDTSKKALTVSDGPRGLLIASEEKEGAVLTGKVLLFLESYGSSVIRLALRSNQPHLLLRADLRIMESGSALEFLSSLRELAQ
jgi:hypothetical protein